MDDLQAAFPIIPHESAGVDCCGCIVLTVAGNDAEMQCKRMWCRRWRRSGWDSEGSGVVDSETWLETTELKSAGRQVQLIDLTPRSDTLWHEWTQNTC